jgi:hypothetical protein
VKILGAILLVCGLFFAAQGAGWIAWPPESFMVSRSPWIGYGLAIAAAGLALTWAAGRNKEKS